MQTQADKEKAQRQFIIEYVKLGMDFYGAAIAAECTQEYIDRLEADESLQQLLNFCLKQKEQELLQRLHKAADIAILKGDTRATERILEILNPERYSKTTKLAHQLGGGASGKGPKAMRIEFVGTDSDAEIAGAADDNKET